jgi:hypothetical protein
MKKMSIGKKLGVIAFFISEVIAVLLTIGVGIGYIPDTNITGLLTFQGSIFVTVFTGVATKNFKKIGEQTE